MAGVIAAFAQRVNMRLAILPLRVTGVFASGIGAGLSSSRIVRAIELAATRGADVIVIARSWPQDSLAVRNAIRAAASVGALIVISAGNASADIDRTRCIPACYAREFPDHVLTVRALGTTSKRPSGSNYFTDLPLLAAPGWQIKTTSGSAYYARRFGQSSAAAAIVGAAAALVSHRLLEPAQRAPAAVAHWLRSHARRERHCEGDGLNLLGRDEHLELDLRDLPRANQGKCRTMDV
jgi:subtilisin family serine protease